MESARFSLGLATWDLGTGMGFRIAEESHYSNVGPNELRSGSKISPQKKLAAKRVFDVVVSSILVIGTLPLLITMMLIIRIQDGHRAIFSQVRIGQNGQRFHCYKLRSMVPDAQERLDNLLKVCPKSRAQWDAVQKLDPDPRITKLGQFLRKSSIDELPQLFNVLRGEMSLVGPRPIIQSEVERYGSYYEDYCSVKPGITGLWQVQGRSNTSYEERVEMDVTYARNQSLLGDIGIFFQTVPAVMLRRGAR